MHTYYVMCCSNTLQSQQHTTPDWFWFWCNVWDDIVLALDEQPQVPWWHGCIVEFVGVVTWLVHVESTIWHDCNCTRIYMLFKNTTMATTHDSGLILISMEYIMEPYRVGLFWTSSLSESVRWYWCTSARMFEFEDVFAWCRCRMHFEIAIAHVHTCMLLKFTPMATTHGCGLILILVEYMGGWLWCWLWTR